MPVALVSATIELLHNEKLDAATVIVKFAFWMQGYNSQSQMCAKRGC